MATKAQSKARWWNRRKRSTPAPELVPPGFSSGTPTQQAPKLEPRNAVERRFLHEVTRAQVRGESQGIPDVMRSDWDRRKLEEAIWLQKQREPKPVDIALLRAHQTLTVRESFARSVRVVRSSVKQAEAEKAQRASRERRHLELEQESDPYPARAPSSSLRGSASEEGFPDDSEFMKKIRARAAERREMDAQREMGRGFSAEPEKPDHGD